MKDVVNFRTHRRRRPLPSWLRDGEGLLVGYVLDLMRDLFVERLRQSLMIRFPQRDPTGRPSPDDALAANGRTRRVIRGIDESSASYAARLIRWLDDRKTAGNAFAVLQKCAEYLGPLPRLRIVDARGNWYTREPDGTTSYLLDQGNWNWDGAPMSRFARFWLIVYPNGLWTEGPDWDDASRSWGDGQCSWGSTATSAQIDTLRAIVADWKRAGSRCEKIIIAFDPDSFDPSAPEPDGTWGHWGKLEGGVMVPARLSTARYCQGTTT